MPPVSSPPADPAVKGSLPEQFSLFSNDEADTSEGVASTPPTGRFSNFIVYVDESGDHGMQTVDPNYPVFVLSFCVFNKRHYSEKVVPTLQKFKFNHFGHDLVVLHEHEIRKEKGSFKFQSRQHKHDFLEALTGIIDASNFILVIIRFGSQILNQIINGFLNLIWIL